MLHELKCLRKYYDAVKNGIKKFEVRKNDRQYKINDYIILYLYDDELEPKEKLYCKITYILDDEAYCKKGYVVMGIQLLEVIKESRGKNA